jgi:hypothetical protein
MDGELRIRYELTGTVLENATDERGYLIVGGDGIVREAGMVHPVGRSQTARRRPVAVGRAGRISGMVVRRGRRSLTAHKPVYRASAPTV